MTEFNLTEIFSHAAQIKDFAGNVAVEIAGGTIHGLLGGAIGGAVVALTKWKSFRNRDFLGENAFAYVRRFELKKTNEINPETGNPFYEFTCYAGDEICLEKVFPKTSSKVMMGSIKKAVKLCPPDRSVVFSKLKEVYADKDRVKAIVNDIDRDWSDFFSAWSYRNKDFLGAQPDNEIFPILVLEGGRAVHELGRRTLHVFMMEPDQMDEAMYPAAEDVKFKKVEDPIYFELARQVAESNAKPENAFVSQICKVQLMKKAELGINLDNPSRIASDCGLNCAP